MKLCSKHLRGDYLIKEATKMQKKHPDEIEVRRGKGDHVIVISHKLKEEKAIPDREIGRGLAASIVKWLVAAGVPLTILVMVILSL